MDKTSELENLVSSANSAEPVAEASGLSPKAYAQNVPENLSQDTSFWGMTATQCLGAFNDNLFKQLLLLIAVSLSVKSDDQSMDLQSIAMLIFSAPFLLFSGPAGFIADKFSKRTVVVLSKVAEILAMLLGVLAFYFYAQLGFAGLFIVLFLMGMQSTFFSPAKYGILPEMLHEHNLPKANGFFLMTTFLAIIFGTVTAGWLSENFQSQLWAGSLVCAAIAILGTITSLLIRKTAPSNPQSKFTKQVFLIPQQTIQLFLNNRDILAALLASCAFWLCAGVVHLSVNSLGIIQLDLGEKWTSVLVGSIGAGIALGCLLAGYFSRGKIEFKLVRIGSWGIFCCLILLCLPGFNHGHLLGFYGSLPVLILLGVFTGMFSVPIQVYLQAKAPEDQKGQVIAEMSRANWVAIFASGLMYGLFDIFLLQFDLNRSWLFAFTAVLILPVAIIYRPQSEALK